MKNICSFCGKPFDFSYKVHYDGRGKPMGCEHDGVFYTLCFNSNDKKIIDRLPPHQMLVKSSDGVSRVCEKIRK